MIKKIIFIMRGFLILFMIFIFSSSFVYAGSAPGTELDFADEWKGTFSGYTKKAYLVIEDETEWQEVWDKAFPNALQAIPGGTSSIFRYDNKFMDNCKYVFLSNLRLREKFIIHT